MSPSSPQSDVSDASPPRRSHSDSGPSSRYLQQPLTTHASSSPRRQHTTIQTDTDDASSPRLPRHTESRTHSMATAHLDISSSSGPLDLAGPSSASPHIWLPARATQPAPSTRRPRQSVPASPASSERASQRAFTATQVKEYSSPSIASQSQQASIQNPPYNRFNIAPGPRWDGVIRSNGFERRLAELHATRARDETDAYLTSIADL